MTDQSRDPDDPRGMIREAYRIEGITEPECRSIFLDWAMFLDVPVAEAAGRLLARHGQVGHPMDEILTQAADAPSAPRRRGGAAGRRS